MSPELRAAVERVLQSRGPGGLRVEAARMSGHYRAGGSSDAAIDLAAYLTVRLPATFAAVARVLEEISVRRPDFDPATLLDAGAGPGTASWAAAARWPAIRRITMADRHPGFLSLARELAANASQRGLAEAVQRQASLASIDGISADLVVASYCLAELPAAGLDAASDALWRASNGMLAIVEPGTPAGFSRIEQARRRLIAKGAVPLAPCPHAGPCPMSGGDWCHFSVRLSRSRAHMHAKQAGVPYEDEKFSYLVLTRGAEPSRGARVLAKPRAGKPGIDFKLCTAAGLEHLRIARRDAVQYKRHRKADWGDLIGIEGENA